MGHEYLPITLSEIYILGMLIACFIVYGLVSDLNIAFKTKIRLGTFTNKYKGPERRSVNRDMYK